ncbi:CotY/CotZ family spore coat protein [Heyndrickxia acidicola]|uniref:CotY/CotZ family spore coat protein n=1 Tax=Heyndrickxia acidicola TaxID=209389 RepID=A0ABU6MCZ6_9BACI|nr:CotY/CotZ family spore coat protein [Heyndrickxia acidicola]MED1202538.1 CotY/CotZ family spore coat protein [Heyndrickxia acidicola]
MGCHNSNSHVKTNCVCDVVNFINDLQDAVNNDPQCPTNCLNPVLGANTNMMKPNTRPFILFTEDGKPFEAFFKSADCDGSDDSLIDSDYGKGDQICKSKFFRVENVDGCCAVLRVLEPRYVSSTCPQVDSPQNNLRASSSCLTVDLRCFCAIQCLEDIFLPEA